MLTKIDKAIAAFILAAAGAYGAGAATGSDADQTAKLVSAVIVGLIAALGVWLTPNKSS